MSTLNDLESRLQTLLEVHLLKTLPGYKAEDRVYQQLAAAMHQSLKEQNGTTYAPNVYVIIAHPATLARWRTEPRLVNDLAVALRTAGEEAGFHFLSNPTVTTAADTDMADDETHIISSFSSESVARPTGCQQNPRPRPRQRSSRPMHSSSWVAQRSSRSPAP
jgi:hypothetical protein